MFCSARESNEEDREWAARREMITKNGARLKAQQCINELDIFSVARSDETREYEATDIHLDEEEPCTASQWKTAVDPQSGRTYYYDAVTRKSQWEKVRNDKSCCRFVSFLSRLVHKVRKD